MGLYFTIGSILMLFVALSTLLIARRQSGKFDPFTGQFVSTWVSTPLPLKLLLVNTFILLLSSVTMELARRAAVVETVLLPICNIAGVAKIKQMSLIWTRVTVAMGLAFLGGQTLVWFRMHAAGLQMDNPLSSSVVILLTAGHALHLFGGLLVLLYISLSKKLQTKYESRRIAVDVSAWYWHFMGAMWLYVFGVLFFVH